MILTSLICLVMLPLPISQQVVVQSSVATSVRSAKVIAKHAIHTRTPIHRLFLDKIHHRLAAQVGDDIQRPTRLAWLYGGSLTTLTSIGQSQGPPDDVLALDFQRQRVFWSSGGMGGGGSYLHSTPFAGSAGANGDLDKVNNEDEAHVRFVVGGKQAGKNYRILRPLVSDLAMPESWGAVYNGNNLVSRFEVGYTPKQILYIDATDQLWIVYNWQMKSLDGVTVPFPNEKPPTFGSYPGPGPNRSVVDTDSSGKIAYYIDAVTKSVYKLSLTSGEVVRHCSLPITPKSIVVDGDQKLIHLLADSGKLYITIRMF